MPSSSGYGCAVLLQCFQLIVWTEVSSRTPSGARPPPGHAHLFLPSESTPRLWCTVVSHAKFFLNVLYPLIFLLQPPFHASFHGQTYEQCSSEDGTNFGWQVLAGKSWREPYFLLCHLWKANIALRLWCVLWPHKQTLPLRQHPSDMRWSSSGNICCGHACWTFPVPQLAACLAFWMPLPLRRRTLLAHLAKALGKCDRT